MCDEMSERHAHPGTMSGCCFWYHVPAAIGKEVHVEHRSALLFAQALCCLVDVSLPFTPLLGTATLFGSSVDRSQSVPT